MFRFYIVAIRSPGIIRLQMHWLDKLHATTGRLVGASHPSLLDVAQLMSVIPWPA